MPPAADSFIDAGYSFAAFLSLLASFFSLAVFAGFFFSSFLISLVFAINLASENYSDKPPLLNTSGLKPFAAGGGPGH
jgi:hypothetical protein